MGWKTNAPGSTGCDGGAVRRIRRSSRSGALAGARLAQATGHGGSLGQPEQEVKDECEHGYQECSAEHLVEPPQRDTLDDRLAEATQIDVGGDGDRGDDLQGRSAQTTDQEG